MTQIQRPLGLTDHQLALVRRAAKAIPVVRRDDFLVAVARRLAPEPSDAAVEAAVNRQLDLVPVFSSTPSKEQTNDKAIRR